MKKIIAVLVLSLIGFNVSANNNAKRLTESLIKDDISAFLDGGDAALDKEIPTVSASQLINEYSNDQYQYEKTYDNEVVYIITVASDVKTDSHGDPYIVANGNNQDEYVSLELKNKDDAITINKDNTIEMICVGTKNNVKFPTLKNCVTTDKYFQKFFKAMMTDINKLKKNDKPHNGFEALYLGFWEFDIKHPGTLDKYETVFELSKNTSAFNEIVNIAESKTFDSSKKLIIPKP